MKRLDTLIKHIKKIKYIKEIETLDYVYEQCSVCEKDMVNIKDIYVTVDTDLYVCGRCVEINNNIGKVIKCLALDKAGDDTR